MNSFSLKLAACSFLTFLNLAAQSQETFPEKSRSTYLLPEVSVFQTIHSEDLVQDEGAASQIRYLSKTGAAFGIGFRKDSRKIFLTITTGLRIVPRKLVSAAGGTNGDFQQTFTNIYSYLKPMIGFKIVPERSSYFDFGMGFNLYYSWRNKRPDPIISTKTYTDPATGEHRQYFYGYTELNWGDTREERFWSPFIFNLAGTVGYTIRLKNGNPLRFALLFSAKLGSNGSHTDNHATQVLFDQDANRISRHQINNQHMALGLNVSLGL